MAMSAAELRREYKRQWAKNNPEKVRAQQARYWEKRAGNNETADDARKAYKRQWARDNPGRVKLQQARYWEKKAAEADGKAQA